MLRKPQPTAVVSIVPLEELHRMRSEPGYKPPEKYILTDPPEEDDAPGEDYQPEERKWLMEVATGIVESEIAALAGPADPMVVSDVATNRLLAGEMQAKAGRGGNVPPAEHRFKPGQSGNPSGAPRRSLTTILRHYLDADQQQRSKLFVRAWYKLACQGNRTALKEFLDRTEGLTKTPAVEAGDDPLKVLREPEVMPE
ncbi:MAG: DUF5681 domain-containing protein [Fimbriimonadaceae bacterium]